MHKYDQTKESTSIQQLDVKNQFGRDLSQPITYGGFGHSEGI